MTAMLAENLQVLPGGDLGWLRVYEYVVIGSRSFEGDVAINKEIRRLLETYPRIQQLNHPWSNLPAPPPPPPIDQEVSQAFADYWKCDTADQVEALILRWAVSRML